MIGTCHLHCALDVPVPVHGRQHVGQRRSDCLGHASDIPARNGGSKLAPSKGKSITETGVDAGFFLAPPHDRSDRDD